MSVANIVCVCDESNFDNVTKYLKKTSNKMGYAEVLQRVAQFFIVPAAKMRSKRMTCFWDYFEASYDSWEDLLKELHRLTKYLRDNEFQDLKIFYDDPTEINALKACAIYSTMITMISNINFFSEAFLSVINKEEYRQEYDHRRILVEQYNSLIKENMIMITVRHRSIALEKYFVGTERSRVIHRLSNSFGLL